MIYQEIWIMQGETPLHRYSVPEAYRLGLATLKRRALNAGYKFAVVSDIKPISEEK